MSPRILHQFVDGATPGDAITDQALAIRGWLRADGYTSDIYAVSIHPALAGEILPAAAYRPQAGETRAVYHHSIGSELVDLMQARQLRLLLIYHNITPPTYFHTVDPALANQLRRGLEQLPLLRPQTALAVGDSAYNAGELAAAGFAPVDVLPITLDESRYQWPDNPVLAAQLAADGAPLLLFVGRLTPNKRQEDLIKLLYYYRRIEPGARLALVGARWSAGYARWLTDLARSLGVAGQVGFTDHVTQQDMVTYYRHASLYVSMSEHEGFGKPLIESMYFQLPVLAYSSSCVPETLGGAGVLFTVKDYEVLAEMADMLIKDPALRARVVERQQQRVQAFLAGSVSQLWRRFMARFWDQSI